MWSSSDLLYGKYLHSDGNSQWGKTSTQFHGFVVNRALAVNVNSWTESLNFSSSIEDHVLLLFKAWLTNLNIEERLALGVSLRMFTRSIVLRRRVEDLQLGVESYQKKLNLTRPRLRTDQI
ncbi:hypothetical protein Tco_1475107 [Tanacetum coccineum]